MEANFADLLDSHDTKWEYETRGPFYLMELNEGYLPDFYLPDSDTFVEIKGDPTDIAFKKLEALALLTGSRVVMITADYAMIYCPKEFNNHGWEHAQWGKCGCGLYFACQTGYFQCKGWEGQKSENRCDVCDCDGDHNLCDLTCDEIINQVAAHIHRLRNRQHDSYY